MYFLLEVSFLRLFSSVNPELFFLDFRMLCYDSESLLGVRHLGYVGGIYVYILGTFITIVDKRKESSKLFNFF